MEITDFTIVVFSQRGSLVDDFVEDSKVTRVSPYGFLYESEAIEWLFTLGSYKAAAVYYVTDCKDIWGRLYRLARQPDIYIYYLIQDYIWCEVCEHPCEDSDHYLDERAYHNLPEELHDRFIQDESYDKIFRHEVFGSDVCSYEQAHGKQPKNTFERIGGNWGYRLTTENGTGG